MKIEIQVPGALKAIAHKVSEAGGQLYLVGGCVRDALLGEDKPKDFDIEVHQLEEEKLMDILSGFGNPSLVGKSFGIILLKIKGEQFDFALPRIERKVEKGHKGFSVQTNPFMGFPEAASRRDFTLNAIGLKLPQFKIEDPWNGMKDLELKTLRHIGPAFSEDPLRALRAVQFAARFHFDIDQGTQLLCSEQDLSELSKERFEEEFRKLLLKAPQPSIGLHWIQKLKLDRYFPELNFDSWILDPLWLCQSLDRFARQSLDWEESDRLIWLHRLIASAIPFEHLSKWLSRFTTDRKLIDGVIGGHGAHLALPNALAEGLGPGNLRRISLKFPLPKLCNYTQCWDSKNWQAEVEALALQWGCWHSAPEPLVQGRDLIALGHKPSRAFGAVLKQAFELQLDEKLCTYEEALNWLKENYRENP